MARIRRNIETNAYEHDCNNSMELWRAVIRFAYNNRKILFKYATFVCALFDAIILRLMQFFFFLSNRKRTDLYAWQKILSALCAVKKELRSACFQFMFNTTETKYRNEERNDSSQRPYWFLNRKNCTAQNMIVFVVVFKCSR